MEINEIIAKAHTAVTNADAVENLAKAHPTAAYGTPFEDVADDMLAMRSIVRQLVSALKEFSEVMDMMGNTDVAHWEAVGKDIITQLNNAITDLTNETDDANDYVQYAITVEGLDNAIRSLSAVREYMAAEKYDQVIRGLISERDKYVALRDLS